jgi:hypothetical protein
MFPQRCGKTESALHAIRGFRMQSNPKGNRLPTFCNSTKSYLGPFSNLPKGNGTSHAIHFNISGFFRILLAVANTLLHAAKRN